LHQSKASLSNQKVEKALRTELPSLVSPGAMLNTLEASRETETVGRMMKLFSLNDKVANFSKIKARDNRTMVSERRA
jgi:hypothetical protein